MATITFRTDADVDRALAGLVSSHRDRSQAIREAILAAWRERESQALRAEAEAIAADEEDRAEVRAVRAEMDALRAW